MRTVNIDFANPENVLPDGSVLGNQGEENATELSITPPAEMQNNEISYFRIAFELTNCRSFHSEKISYGNKIRYLLKSDVTSSETIAIQLEGYNNEGTLLVKSLMVSNLKFNPSVCGTEVSSGSSKNIGLDVAKNTAFRENFDETTNGTLLYKGIPIGETPVKTLPLNSGELFFDTRTINVSGDYFWVIYSVGRNDSTDKMIKDIRFISDEFGTVSIHDLYAYSKLPILINSNKAFYDEGFDGTVFAYVNLFGESNPVLDNAANYLARGFEIDYVE